MIPNPTFLVLYQEQPSVIQSLPKIHYVIPEDFQNYFFFGLGTLPEVTPFIRVQSQTKGERRED